MGDGNKFSLPRVEAGKVGGGGSNRCLNGEPLKVFTASIPTLCNL